MGVLDIYGFEIFEVRQNLANQNFITYKRLLRQALCVRVLVSVRSLLTVTKGSGALFRSD